MAKSYMRVCRGMVFWFDPTRTYGEESSFTVYNNKKYPSHLQRENRPWIVVSNNEGNNTAPTCNIVPVTLEDKNPLPCHVKYMYEGKQQTVLVEQMRTVDIMALKDYIYIVSDDVLRDIEKAIAIQFSIRPSISTTDFTLSTTLKNLERVVAEIIQSKVETYKKELQNNIIPVSQIEDTALHLGQMLEDLCGEIAQKPATEKTIVEKVKEPTPVVEPKEPAKPIKETKPIITPTKPSKPLSQIEKFNLKLEKSKRLNNEVAQEIVNIEKPVDTNSDNTPEKKKRNTWTIESRQAYLDDFKKLSPSDIMKKWNLSSIQSVFQTKYLCKNALSKQGISEE